MTDIDGVDQCIPLGSHALGAGHLWLFYTVGPRETIVRSGHGEDYSALRRSGHFLWILTLDVCQRPFRRGSRGRYRTKPQGIATVVPKIAPFPQVEMGRALESW
jgi:hypothetical protein